MPNYKNSKIYKICNKINDLIYIGSTTNSLSRRMATHRNDMRKECNKNSRLYKIMHKLGMCNFKIVLIEHYPCNNKIELLRPERYYFEIYEKNILLNSNRIIISNVEKKTR